MSKHRDESDSDKGRKGGKETERDGEAAQSLLDTDCFSVLMTVLFSKLQATVNSDTAVLVSLRPRCPP